MPHIRDIYTREQIRDNFAEILMDMLLNDDDTPTTPPHAADEALRKFLKAPLTVNVDATCSVCIEKFSGIEGTTELPCGHQYHKTCVLTWFEINDTCPTCRDSLNNYLAEENARI